MIKRMREMPAGVIGLEASGKLTKADYTDVLEPALHEAEASGELRVLLVLRGFDGLEGAALLEDLRTGANVLVRGHKSWKRFALVTDTEWVRKATGALDWAIPGEVFVGDLSQVDEAKAWVAQ